MNALGRLLVLSTFLFSLHPNAATQESVEPWRIVLQLFPHLNQSNQYQPPNNLLAVDSTGRYAALRTGPILSLVDIKKPQVSLTSKFSNVIYSAAISDDNSKLAVSAGNNIYIIDVKRGTKELLLKGCAGVLGFDKTGNRICILGTLPAYYQPADDLYYTQNIYPYRLGAFNIKTNVWEGRVSTNVVIPKTAVFYNNLLIGFGIGGQPRHHARRIYQCHTIYDLVGKGIINERGGLRTGSKENANNYKIPVPVKEYQALKLRTAKKLQQINKTKGIFFYSEHLNIETKPILRGKNINYYFMARNDSPYLGIDSDGQIVKNNSKSNYSFENASEFLEIDRRDRKIFIKNKSAGKKIAKIDWNPVRDEINTCFLTPKWLVTREWNKITLYENTSGEKLCSAEFYSLLSSPSFSRDFSLMGLMQGGENKFAARIIEVPTGKLIKTIPLNPRSKKSKNFLSFSADKKLLITATNKFRNDETYEILIHNISSRELLVTAKLPLIEQIVEINNGSWIIKTTKGMRVINKNGLNKTIIPYRGYGELTTQHLPYHKNSKVCFEDNRFRGVLDFNKNKILFKSSAIGKTSFLINNKVAALYTNQSHLIEFKDTKTWETLFYFCPIFLDNQMEWIAFTPEEFWDSSSEKAEKYITIFNKETLVDEERKQSRRRKNLIKNIFACFIDD